jgi:uncharacterized membrane protein YidH (DUF202 family)
MVDDGAERARMSGRGLGRERTDLAWNRSGLAVLVTVVIVLRRLWPLHGDRGVAALALIAGGAVVWAAGMRISRHVGDPGTPHMMSESAGRLMTIGTLALAVAGFIVAIL